MFWGSTGGSSALPWSAGLQQKRRMCKRRALQSSRAALLFQAKECRKKGHAPTLLSRILSPRLPPVTTGTKTRRKERRARIRGQKNQGRRGQLTSHRPREEERMEREDLISCYKWGGVRMWRAGSERASFRTPGQRWK